MLEATRLLARVRRWTSIAAGAFAVKAACDGGLIALHRMGAAALEERDYSAAGFARAALTMHSLDLLLLAIVSLVFLIWVHAAFSAAWIVARGKSLPKPWNAVAGYIIPIISLWYPIVDMRRLVVAIDPNDIELAPTMRARENVGYRERAFEEVPHARFVTLIPIWPWWALTFVPMVTSLMNKPAWTTENLFWLDVGEASELVRAVLTIAIVIGVDRAMRERSRRLALTAAR